MNAIRESRAFTDEEQADLRARVRQLMEIEGKNQKALSDESGIAYGTFTGWLAGTYQGNNDAVAGKVVLWLESREEKKRAKVQIPAPPEFVETPSAADFIDVMRFAQVMPDIAVIGGGAGIGKTTAARRYAAKNPNVVLVTVHPSASSVYTMLGAIAEEIGLQERVQTRLFRAIGRKLQGGQALIILDEAQHLDTKALEQLRAFHDIFGLGIALVGNETVYARLEGGKRDAQFAQLFSRVGFRITRAKPRAQDICALLKAWEVTDKDELKFCKAIAGKPGALRVLTKTLQVASVQAAGSGEARALAHIKAAYEQLERAAG
jgi:DNA transposition AAA+ family ATPase